jgi:hypothetical protein
MKIYFRLDGIHHHENPEDVAHHFQQLATLLLNQGYDVEKALEQFRQGDTVYGFIGEVPARNKDGKGYYKKAMILLERKFDEPLKGNFDQRLLSIRTMLDFFKPLIIEKNKDLLARLYQRERALLEKEIKE